MVSRKIILFSVSLLSLLDLSGCALSNQAGNCTLSGQYGDQQSCQTKNPSANCSLSTVVSPDGQVLACWIAIPKVTTNQQGNSPTNGEYLAGGIHTQQQCRANSDATIEQMNGASYCGIKGRRCPDSWKTLTKNGIPYTSTYNVSSMTKGYGVLEGDNYLNIDEGQLQCNRILPKEYNGRKTYEPKPPVNYSICTSYTVAERDSKGCIYAVDCEMIAKLYFYVERLLCY